MIINYLYSLICQKICIFTTDYQAVIMNTKNLAEVFSETDLTYIQQLDERQHRLYCATRAISIGKHGVAAVCASIHISKNTIYRGIRELNGKTILSSETVRIAGGGRKAILDKHPEYLVLFDEIVQKHMAGLPQDDSVRWLDISIAQIVQIFKEHGISISPYIARKMVKLRGFKKRSFHKTKTLKEVKNRDAQFKLLEATWISCVRLGIPVLSIDTKKKEMLGNFKRAGKTFSCQELAALDHDFVSFSNGTIIPHGIYDVERNVGYLTIGNSHDTAEFVCDNIARIWKDYLQWEYPKATSICILCDGGGSNSASHHIFKQELLKLATSLELDIIIVHYPPYCSKYNPIEHRLFAHITRSWSGVPLLSAEYACKKANETTTSKGLVVVASINSKEYQTQRTLDESYVSERQKRIIFDEQLPKWNYVVRCKSA